MTRSNRSPRNRSLIKQLDASTARVWIIDADGELVHVSPTMAEWLQTLSSDRDGTGSDGNEVLDLEQIAETWIEALLPDPMIDARGYATRRWFPVRSSSAKSPDRRIQPTSGPANSHPSVANLDPVEIAHWVRLGTTGFTLGCVGKFLRDAEVPFSDWIGDSGLRQQSLLEEQLHKHRMAVGRTVEILLTGESSAAELLRRRIAAASSVRCHLGLFAPTTHSSRELALHLHDASAADETLTIVDGALMDAELLEAYAAPAIHALNHGEPDRARATLLVERLDEMPDEAQLKLTQWMEVFGDRLRLIGLLDPASKIHSSSASSDHDPLDAQIAELTRMPQATTGIAKPVLNAMRTMPILLPALKERREDIPAMALALLREAHRNRPAKRRRFETADLPRIGRDAADALLLYPWPDNFEELAEAMESALARVVGDRIGKEHLPLAIRSYQLPNSIEKASKPTTDGDNIDHQFRISSLDEAVQKYERELIEKAMNASGGNKAEAARRLGISRARLLRKLES
ncbi:Fis family transcriptional regulator [Rhodopirellula sp. JC740]|uniref:Fis family transcriptional regulator n=1 Tax=Rhodopirellula halodulae TaxID=2894198 RepID=A0ABS8ND52_9BACT|nr:helix-turn-helix domain-containing protein [Rhodopirellula sp. JC740]MCC9641479.1 Fis family transcriptional regulator [Rhodopirellula sp. JC740]